MIRAGARAGMGSIGAVARAALQAALAAACVAAPLTAAAQEALPPTGRAADYNDYLLASLALEEGDYAGAVSHYQALADRAAEPGRWLEAGLLAALASGDPTAALALARRLEEAHAGTPTAALTLAAEALRRRDWEAAQARLEAFDGEANQALAAGLLRVWALAGDGDTDEALEVLTALPRFRAITSVLPYQRAMVLELDRRFDAAVTAYAEASAGQRVLVDNVLRHAAFLQRRGRDAEAAALFEAMSRRIGNVAFAAAREGRYQAPAPSAARNAALGFTAFGRNLADEYLPVEAASYLTLALILDPDHWGGRLSLGVQLRAMRQTAAAERMLGSIPADSVYFEAAQVEIAEIWAAAGRGDEALALVRALAAATQGRFSWRALADIALSQGAFAEAEAASTALIAGEDPASRQWRPYLIRGQARMGLDRWPEAEADLREGLRIDADQPELLRVLAEGLLREGGRAEEAQGLLETALEANPADPQVLRALGAAYVATGRYEAAIAVLEEGLRRQPGSAAMAAELADALWLSGRHREARFQWTRALDRETDEARRTMLQDRLAAGLASPP